MLDLHYNVTPLQIAPQIVEIEFESEEKLEVDINQITRDVLLFKPSTQKESQANKVLADFNKSNILPERATKRKKKQQTYAVVLHQFSQRYLNFFHSAFLAFIVIESQRKCLNIFMLKAF